jgi:hypothetical protein
VTIGTNNDNTRNDFAAIHVCLWTGMRRLCWWIGRPRSTGRYDPWHSGLPGASEIAKGSGIYQGGIPAVVQGILDCTC